MDVAAPREKPSQGNARALAIGAGLAALAHATWIAWRIAHGAWFVTDDDPYRLYHGHLAASGSPTIFSRLWPPGHALVVALFDRIGVPLVVVGFLLGIVATTATVVALASIARTLDGGDVGRATRSTALVALATPWFLHVAYGGLAEPLAMALASIAAACAYARVNGASRRVLVAGSVALLAATWVRYETWWFVPFFAIGIPAARRASGVSGRAPTADDGATAPVAWRVLAADAALAAIPAVGPLAWLYGESATFGDALAFLHNNQEISSQILGRPDRLGVSWHRLHDVAIEAPAALALGVLGLLKAPSPRARILVAAGLAPLVAQGVDGHEQTVYPARLVAPLVLALIPLAAISLARLRTSIALFVALSPLVLVPFTQSHLLDESSVEFGRALRAHRFDRQLDRGALLVERELRRPPFGWASVGVLWETWPRTVFGTHSGHRWEMSEPSNVRVGHFFVDDAALSSWLTSRGVRGAWVLTPGARAATKNAWGAIETMPVEEGNFIVPAASSRPGGIALGNDR